MLHLNIYIKDLKKPPLFRKEYDLPRLHCLRWVPAVRFSGLFSGRQSKCWTQVFDVAENSSRRNGLVVLFPAIPFLPPMKKTPSPPGSHADSFSWKMFVLLKNLLGKNQSGQKNTRWWFQNIFYISPLLGVS